MWLRAAQESKEALQYCTGGKSGEGNEDTPRQVRVLADLAQGALPGCQDKQLGEGGWDEGGASLDRAPVARDHAHHILYRGRMLQRVMHIVYDHAPVARDHAHHILYSARQLQRLLHCVHVRAARVNGARVTTESVSRLRT